MSIGSVAHVLWSGEVGGIERLVRDLAATQVSDGMDVTVAFGRAKGPFVESVRETDARVVDLNLASGYDLRPSRVARGAAALQGTDVLHLHGFNGPLAALTLHLRRPLVFTEHGAFGLGRWVGPTEHVKRRMQMHFLRRRVTRLAANSSYTARRLAETYGIDAKSVTAIHNGVAFPSFQPGMPARDHPDSFGVAFVGRLVSWKRVDLLLDAVARAETRGSIRVQIVGTGPLDSMLRSRSFALGLSEHVAFLGYRHDLSAIFSQADVLVHPSVGEPFGLAILEACGQGLLPIVFADGGGAIEVLPPDGVVVRDVSDLARVLDSLGSSSSLLAKARLARANWARAMFPISKTAAAYYQLYDSASKAYIRSAAK